MVVWMRYILLPNGYVVVIIKHKQVKLQVAMLLGISMYFRFDPTALTSASPTSRLFRGSSFLNHLQFVLHDLGEFFQVPSLIQTHGFHSFY